METLRRTLFILVFMWLGIIFTVDTLDGLPRSDWTSAAVKLGLGMTVAVVLVEVAFQAARRHLARAKDTTAAH